MLLVNGRLEQYARKLAELELSGLSRAEFAKARLKAYAESGFAANPDNARRDANRPAVKERKAVLMAERLEYCDVRLEAVINRIDRVGRVNLADLYEDDGITAKNIKSLPRELSSTIKSLKVNKDTGMVELELFDQNQANFTLLKHFGGLPDDDKRGGDDNRRTVNIFNLPIEDQRLLIEALEALAGEPGADSGAAQGQRAA